MRRKCAYRRKIPVTAGVGVRAGPVGGWHARYDGTFVTGVRMDAAAGATATLAHRIYLPKEINTRVKYFVTNHHSLAF